MRALIMGLLLLLAAGAVVGADAERSENPLPVEASLRVSGSIEVDAKGAVTAHHVDQADKLDPGVLALIEHGVEDWRFQPVTVDGEPRAVKAEMSLLLIAKKTDAGQTQIRIEHARFNQSGVPDTDRLTFRKRGRLSYPFAAGASGVSATVYVALRVDRAGNVVDAAARQVNLHFRASARAMEKWREEFANPTVKSARGWKFNPPSTGPDAAAPYITALVPVCYCLGQGPAVTYGRWVSYIPGPRSEIPWLDTETQAGDDAEALADGQIAQAGAGLRLLTPLGGE